MIKHNRILMVFVLLVLLCLAFGLMCLLLDIRFVLFDHNKKELATCELKWNQSYNLKQEGNTCGAHAVMAVLGTEKDVFIDPYQIYDSIPEKLGRGYVFPWGLTRYLNKYSIKMKSFYLGLLSDTKKINWIEKQISMDNPVVLIVGTKRYLHYITILGYSEKSFHIYDSEVVGNKNLDKPGNISIPKQEMINHMKSAYFKGLYLNMAISY